MNRRPVFNNKGVTLIELLVALVISGVIIAGIYRMFVGQTRAYTVQEQVVEVQQNIRGAMELILRDVRMAGYTSNINPVTLTTSIFPGNASMTTVSDDAIRVEYQRKGVRNIVSYRLDNSDPNNIKIMRYTDIDGTTTDEEFLENVNALTFTYGVDGIVGLDTSQDGAMDDKNTDGKIDGDDFYTGAQVSAGNLNIIAIRISLTAEPSNPKNNPDIANIVPRNLVSTVNLRNLCLIKSN